MFTFCSIAVSTATEDTPKKSRGATAPPVIASAAKQSTFPRGHSLEALAHGLRSQLLLRIAASAHKALGNRLASGGRNGPGEVAAGSHTNSTVDVYAMNGVSVQAKVHFLF
jgi:hypothetical protein